MLFEALVLKLMPEMIMVSPGFADIGVKAVIDGTPDGGPMTVSSAFELRTEPPILETTTE